MTTSEEALAESERYPVDGAWVLVMAKAAAPQPGSVFHGLCVVRIEDTPDIGLGGVRQDLATSSAYLVKVGLR